jgi:hypothetical protein
MDRDHMDKLIHDIQQYLRDEDSKKQPVTSEPLSTSEDSTTTHAKPSFSRAATEMILLISACTTALLTVAIILIGLIDGEARAATGTMTLLIIGGCGMFFSIVLISIWKRLVLLGQIEENTRLILASKLEANAILERLIHK